MQTTYLLLLSALLNNIQYKSPEEDLVKSVPDYECTGKLYSGYLKVGRSKHFHYMFNLAEEETESDKKPLVLWLNGGPGCSSLEGWAKENGPMSFKNDETFVKNEYSWNKAANMLYIESPGEVGFSYIDSGSGNEVVNDDNTAKDNMNALLSFFIKFPEFKGRDFYISGESYAGVYIPLLALEIINYNKNVPDGYKINLKGILIGNGLTHRTYDSDYFRILYMFSHHIISYEMRMQFNQDCYLNFNRSKCDDFNKKLKKTIENINIYNYLEDCETPKYSGQINYHADYFLLNAWAFPDLEEKQNMMKSNAGTFLSLGEEESEGGPQCVDTKPLYNYFNRKDVKEALHINKEKEWKLCNEKINKNYIQQYKTSYWAYPALFENNIRVLIYNGDADIVVPFNGNQLWIESLGLEEISPWRQWRAYDDKNNIAGYTVKYKGLTFCTIKGAGHEVPVSKPKESLYMLTKFLNNEDL
jgi:carboxypeptidase C (cathepsin A)